MMEAGREYILFSFHTLLNRILTSIVFSEYAQRAGPDMIVKGEN